MRTMLISALAVAFAFAPPLRAAEPVNVVLIVVDDLGWADLGCYGSKYHHTPQLDRLAAAGARFTDAYAAAPVGAPSRAALLTGKFPARLNLTDSLPRRDVRPDQKLMRPAIVEELPEDVLTLAAALKAQGYATGHVGKWNLGGKGAGPEKRGFTHSVGGDQTDAPPSYFAPYKTTDGVALPGLGDAAKDEYLTDRLTAEAEKFIAANGDKPFFLYVAHYAVHQPLQATPDLAAKYKPGQAGQQGNPAYAAMIESLDDGVGRLLKKLDDLKLTERTVVIFTSSNGGVCVADGTEAAPTINAPLREGKGSLYEGGLRVPLIVRWPGVTKPGSTAGTVVCGTDLFPTVLEACGVKGDGKADGMSLVSLLKGESLKRDAVFFHYPHYSDQGGRPGAAIRAGNYKLVEYFEDGRCELFDLARDAGESRNLVQDKPEVVKALRDKLAAWQKEVGARATKPNPDYTPNPQAKDGTIALPARTATVHGVMLRYEPVPHKNTLGFWTKAEDSASWEFTVTKPGKFTVEVLQGCGKGQGGSDVAVTVGEQTLNFTVEDTGHFQNFKAREIGKLTLDKPGRYTLTVQPKKKAAAAVMDLRAVTLKPGE